MKAVELIIELQSKGVRLIPKGNRLILDAPQGVLTDDLRETLSTHKAAILLFLRTNASERTTERKQQLATYIENCFHCGGEGVCSCSRCSTATHFGQCRACQGTKLLVSITVH
jgi:hypothetical protein